MNEKWRCYSCLKLWPKLEKSLKNDGLDGELINLAIGKVEVIHRAIVRPLYLSVAIVGVSILVHFKYFIEAGFFSAGLIIGVFFVERRLAVMRNCLNPSRITPNQEYTLALNILSHKDKASRLNSIINEDRLVTELEVEALSVSRCTSNTPPQALLDVARNHLYNTLKMNQVSGKNKFTALKDKFIIKRHYHFDYVVVHPFNLIGLILLGRLASKRKSVFIHTDGDTGSDGLDKELIKDPVIREFVIQSIRLEYCDIPADPDEFLHFVKIKLSAKLKEGLCEFSTTLNQVNLRLDQLSKNKLIPGDIKKDKLIIPKWLTPHYQLKMTNNILMRDEVTFDKAIISGSGGQYVQDCHSIKHLWPDRDRERFLNNLKKTFIEAVVHMDESISD